MANGIYIALFLGSSQHYIKGKFVQDGHYDPEAVSKQIGGGVLLKRVVENGLVEKPWSNTKLLQGVAFWNTTEWVSLSDKQEALIYM